MPKFKMPKDSIKKGVLLLIILYVFLLSIKLLGGAFKLFGKEFAESLITFTANPFIALFIGILATTLVQSSSVSTSVIVGLVAAGAMNVSNAIPIVMGANIGTSVTNTIISMAHVTKNSEFKKAFPAAVVHDFFNLLVVLVLFPIEMMFHVLEKSALFLTQFLVGAGGATFTSPINLIVKPAAKFIQHYLLFDNPLLMLLVSLAVLFLSLRYFVVIMKPLAQSEFKHIIHEHIFKHPSRSLLFGVLFTIMVQSSSVTTSLIVPFAALGILNIEQVFPYILGANIGTTVTALLASLATSSAAALTIAIVHVLFNVFGSIFMYPLRKIPISMAEWITVLCSKSKVYPIAYIACVFYVIPAVVILLS